MKNYIKTSLVALAFISLFSCKTYCDNGLESNGLQVEYYNNKVRRSETEVKNCLCSGLVKRYYPNGNLSSTGNCVKGSKTGKWNFFDNNGFKKAISEWEDGQLIGYTINLNSGDQVFYDNKNNKLYNTAKSQVIEDTSIREMFNNSTEVDLLNDTMFALNNYGSLLVVSKDLEVLFNLKQIKEQQFWEIYKRRSINLEIDNRFLKDGLDYFIQDNSIYIKVYYRETYNDIVPKVRNFMFPFLS